MSFDQRPIRLAERRPPPVDPDIADVDLLRFALDFAGTTATAAASRLLAEFGDIELILASDPDELRRRGGLSGRAVAVLKLLDAFRADCRRGRIVH